MFAKLRLSLLSLFLSGVLAAFAIAAPLPLFNATSPSTQQLPKHTKAAQSITINPQALQEKSFAINLFGDRVVAVRKKVEPFKTGEVAWIGNLQDNPEDRVIITTNGQQFSGIIQRGTRMFRIGVTPAGMTQLYEVDYGSFPPDDAGPLPNGSDGTSPPPRDPQAVGDSHVQQDLLVVYTQGACTSAGSCGQLEADIATAVADINTSYAESGINITMNLVGTALTNYTGTSASTALNDLRGTSDGQMDEVHPLRDQLGADLVALIYDGEGCGIGYLPASPTYAFSVTDEPCLVGNRTMAHEIGHNQGAHHDRVTVGGGTSGAYNYGFRRCNDGSVDDLGAPYFRTILAYSCNGSPRVGRFSSPNITYSGVPQGVDPAVNPAKGAFNARTLNESASYVAGFRPTAVLPVATTYIETQSVSVPAGASDFSIEFFPTVPVGQRLSIESVTAQVFVGEDNLTALCRMYIETVNPSEFSQRQDLELSEQPTGVGSDVYVVSEPTRLAFQRDPVPLNKKIVFRCNTSPMDTQRTQTATISGHFFKE